jgi:hypothetical protein
MDGKKDGNETDVDCGGTCTIKCADGKMCAVNGDCVNGDCFGGTCVSCMDGKKDGNETDVDCGGSCGPCAFGAGCKVGGDCKSGFCVSMKCGADTLASGQMAASAIAVDAANLYWITSGSQSSATGTVMKLPLGSTTPMTLAASQNRPTGMATDAAFVYWCNTGFAGNDGSVWKVLITGGTPVNLATNLAGPGPIAIAGTTVYWGLVGVGGYGTGEIDKEPLGSTMGTAVVTGINIGSLINYNGTESFYFLGSTGPGPLVLKNYYPQGGVTTVVASVPSVSVAIAIDDSNVYWSDISQGGILKKNFQSSLVATIAPSATPANSMKIDSTFVYWTTGPSGSPSSGSVMKAPLAGTTTPTVLVPNQNSPGAITVDSTYVYWTDSFDNAVYRVLK